jgi:aminopeptidase N
VFITTDSLNKAGSNGLLKNVVVVGNKKRFEWKSRTPIDYYLISIAVAKYKEYRQYAKPQYLVNDSILIQNYIYDGAINNTSWINSQKVQLNKMPQVLSFLSNMYGMYPFYKEKYGHCMAPVGGGMEHQTMTTLGFFDYYIDAHELGHQWWGDQVTCKTWGDIWINEGFASYTEHLVAQYLDPTNFASNLNAAHQSVMGQPGGSVYFTNADTMDSQRIFDSRLTYDKGGAIIHSLRFLTNNDSAWFNALRGFQTTYKNSTASAIDFRNFYQTSTGVNATVFFNQWYFGEGYPTYTVKFHQRNNNTFYLKSSQSTSMPSSVPVFIIPVEYAIKRIGKPDTIVRLPHTVAVENYTIPLTGTVTGVSVDPNNWIINAASVSRDTSLGYVAPPPVDPNPVGLQESTNWTQIAAGPNPVKQVYTIEVPSGLVGTVQVMDLHGKLVLQQSVGVHTELNLEHLPEGVYLVSIRDQSNQERWSTKVMKK